MTSLALSGSVRIIIVLSRIVASFNLVYCRMYSKDMFVHFSTVLALSFRGRGSDDVATAENKNVLWSIGDKYVPI